MTVSINHLAVRRTDIDLQSAELENASDISVGDLVWWGDNIDCGIVVRGLYYIPAPVGSYEVSLAVIDVFWTSWGAVCRYHITSGAVQRVTR